MLVIREILDWWAVEATDGKVHFTVGKVDVTNGNVDVTNGKVDVTNGKVLEIADCSVQCTTYLRPLGRDIKRLFFRTQLLISLGARNKLPKVITYLSFTILRP